MHLSPYLKIFPYPDDPEYLLLFSTKNCALALMPKEDGLSLRQGVVPDEYIETLVELGMLVPDLEEERREVFDMLAEINRRDTGLNVAVILGMACNFACLYCYEGSLKKHQAMDDPTAAQLVAFLQKRYVTRNKKRLCLDFYGGEPLLYVEKILDIAGPLKRFVEKRDGDFRFSLVTNGSLLTREVVKKLLPAGLYAAKVTVDGPPDEHNRLRPFKSGEPSFAAILDNINACYDLIKIGFGGNYTEENSTRVPELLDTIEGLGLTPEKFGNVQFHPVIQTADQYARPEFTGGCSSVNEPWLAEAAPMIRGEVLRRGYRTPKLTPSPCMVDLNDAFVVNHDGDLYKCVAMIGHPDYTVGDIYQGLSDTQEAYRPHLHQQNPECRDCAYLPLCFGGCRYMEFQRSGSITKVDCMRDFWDQTLEVTVRQDACFQTASESTKRG